MRNLFSRSTAKHKLPGVHTFGSCLHAGYHLSDTERIRCSAIKVSKASALSLVGIVNIIIKGSRFFYFYKGNYLFLFIARVFGSEVCVHCERRMQSYSNHVIPVR